MVRVDSKFLEGLCNKDLIAYGTGNTGTLVIPYLAQDPNVRLHGVTNSRISSQDGGTYLDTGLPVRSIQAWAERLPGAAVLVTAFRGYEEIYERCRSAGFQEILFLDWELVDAISQAAESAAEAQQAAMLNMVCEAAEIHDAHRAAFAEFKGRHRGQTVVVAGSGPTLDYYEPLPGAAHIGVNSVFLKLNLDYYFLLHYMPEWCSELKKCACVKFFWVNRRSKTDTTFPEHVIEENHARMFYNTVTSSRLHTNIEYYPLAGFHSVIFPALQFALYTRPKRILLVGCDCSADGHFDGEPYGRFTGQNVARTWPNAYRKLSAFAQLHYPDTEIVSVNPVGLRGMFRDVYTEACLNAHPDIERSGCTLLSDFEKGEPDQ